MVALSNKVEERDSLDELSSRERELILTVTTSHLLRKPNRGRQPARIKARKKEAVEQLVQQMVSKDRRMFRKPVSVDIHIDAAIEHQSPKFGRIAKEYVDLLKKVVVPDDAFIDHMMVTFQFSKRRGTTASYRVVPSSLFLADYDRFFRVGADLDSYDDDPRSGSLKRFDEHDRSYLRGHEGVVNLILELDADEQAQLDEDPDCWVDLQIPSGYEGFEEADTRASIRRDYESICRKERGRWFTDHGCDIRDRPGGAPHWFSDLEQIGDAEVVTLDLDAPGIMKLAPPKRDEAGEFPPLEEEAAKAWGATVKHDSAWFDMSFPDPLILDIGLAGHAAHRSDIDNVAYKVIEGFESRFFHNKPTVVGFRTYRQQSDTSYIRAKAMPAGRLLHLRASIEEARNYVREARPQREKALPF